MLGKAQAVANEPYQTYQGPLTAGASKLQTKAFKGLGSLAVPKAIGDAATTAGNVANKLSGMSYDPMTATNQYKAPQGYESVGGSFDAEQARQYMNPYLQMSLDPQLEEARRQSQITQMGNSAKMIQAGAFGGSRQALMDAETQRNLGTNLANITGTGYNTAYTNAQTQFNADQARKIQEAQFGASQGMTAAQLSAQYGLSAEQATEMSRQFGFTSGITAQNAALNAANTQGELGASANQVERANLAAQLAGGETQRAIKQQGITADYNEFVNQREYPKEQLKFQQSMLQGLPISTVYNTPVGQTSGQQAVGNTTDATALLKELGVIK
jgi:hypothetical protein